MRVRRTVRYGAPGAPTARRARTPAPHARVIPKRARGGLEQITLPNGVRILLDKRPGAPTMTFAIGVTAGSLQDPKGKEGGAHLIEHMFFKGTKKRTARLINTQLDAMGGAGNASTRLKDIQFYTTVPTAEARAAVDLFTDIFMHPNATPDALKAESAIVQQELRQRGTRSAAFEMEAGRLLLGDQPLATWAGGNAKAVQSMTPADIRSYVRKHFTGRNTVVLLSGDPRSFDLKTVRRRLSKLKAGTAVSNTGLFQGFRKGSLAELVPDETSPQVSVALLFPGLPTSDPLSAAADVLGVLMGAGFSGKLNKRLREQDNITYGVHGSHDASADYGAFDFRTDVAPENVRKAVAALVDEVRKAGSQLTDEDIELAKRQARNRLLMGRAKPGASGVGALDDVLNGERHLSLEQALARLDAVTPAQVREVAKRLLDFQQAKWALRGPLKDLTAVKGGLEDAKAGVTLTEVPFDEARYKQAVEPAAPAAKPASG